MQPAMTVEDLNRFLAVEFPQAFYPGTEFVIEEVWSGGCRMRQRYSDKLLRPGNTVSGAVLMTLADLAMYIAVLATIGPVPLAVTTSLNINFLRKPAQSDVLAEVRLMKVGKRLVVGEVTLRSDGTEAPVAHATATYSVPPTRQVT